MTKDLFPLLFKVIPDLGLYRYDGLAVTRSTARQTEKLKQRLAKVFEDQKLKITVTANIHSVNFLDVNFDLNKGEFKAFMKPNDNPMYVHSLSNHPKSISLAVNDRLNRISANKNVFDAVAPTYQEALRKSDYDHNLSFNPLKT